MAASEWAAFGFARLAGGASSAGLHRIWGVDDMTTRSYGCVSIFVIALMAGLAGCAQNQNAEELKQGWNRDKRLDLNTATKEQLMMLPGMSSAEADKVIAGRPYENAGELVMRGILPKNEYDKIADRVTARIWRAGGWTGGGLYDPRCRQSYGKLNLNLTGQTAESLPQSKIRHSASDRRAGRCQLREAG